jgi:putative ABC transport system ATP-binding protein
MNQEIWGFVNDQKPAIFVNDRSADPAGWGIWNRRFHRLERFFIFGMIELKNVTRRYQQGENVVLALDDVSLRIGTQEFVAVTGESGSGKSTFLHLVGGLDKPDAGEVLVNGLALQSASEKELTEYRARDLGIVFQFFNLLPTLNVLENVCVPLQFQGIKLREAVARAREMLTLVGMEKRERHFVHQLSGGEMQRTAIARALVHRPKVLLADEPTGNLDGANAEKVLEIFRRISDERLTTLVVVTHSIEVAETAERRIHLRNGRVEAEREARVAVSAFRRVP